MEYEEILFNGIPLNEEVSEEALKYFLRDAEIIISDYGLAWSKDLIVGVETSVRGAGLRFKDGLRTGGHNIHSKLIIKK